MTHYYPAVWETAFHGASLLSVSTLSVLVSGPKKAMSTTSCLEDLDAKNNSHTLLFVLIVLTSLATAFSCIRSKYNMRGKFAYIAPFLSTANVGVAIALASNFVDLAGTSDCFDHYESKSKIPYDPETLVYTIVVCGAIAMIASLYGIGGNRRKTYNGKEIELFTSFRQKSRMLANLGMLISSLMVVEFNLKADTTCTQENQVVYQNAIAFVAMAGVISSMATNEDNEKDPNAYKLSRLSLIVAAVVSLAQGAVGARFPCPHEKDTRDRVADAQFFIIIGSAVVEIIPWDKLDLESTALVAIIFEELNNGLGAVGKAAMGLTTGLSSQKELEHTNGDMSTLRLTSDSRNEKAQLQFV